MNHFEQNKQESLTERLKRLRPIIDNEIKRAKDLIKTREDNVDSEDFDLRGELYRLAFEVAPNARGQDLIYMKQWIKPFNGERVVDIAAGTGFLTIPLTSWTNGKTYAIDPSEVQLSNLDKKKGGFDIESITGSLSDKETLNSIGEDIGNIDLVTSYGGLHHVVDINGVNRQKELFKNVAELLKSGGKFIVGDVGADTDLAKHFENSVKQHCLTSHEEKWLNGARLQKELIEDTKLHYIKSEVIPVKWSFDNEEQLALFMKCLHAYDMSDEEILNDLKLFLGYEKDELGKCILNWPMLFFELEKE